MVNIHKIIDDIRNMDKQIRDLEAEKSQLEFFIAVVAKKLDKDITFEYKELLKADYSKVRLIPDESNSSKVTVKYIES